MTPAASATVVSELTPPGRAAVAVVLVAGPQSLRAVGNCFAPRNRRRTEEFPSGQIILGRWGLPDGEELIVCRRDEDQIEIHCHGGAAAVQAVVNRLVKEGCQQITWQEWLDRSSPDRIRVAAQIALADVATERTAAIMIDQLNGALAAAIRRILSEISTANWPAATEMIDELLNRREMGLHLTKAWRVVVVGVPNVGKSSIINALAGFERAIVSPAPGTTRDVVTVTTAIDGWPVQLADTAGLRATPDELESAGIELATMTASEADLIIFVHDAVKLRDELVNGSVEPVRSAVKSPSRTIRVINKIDLIPVAERSDLLVRLTDSHAEISNLRFVSALTGEGIADLVATISRSLVPIALSAGSAVPFTTEQIDWLTAARVAVERHDTPAAGTVLRV